jgi:hypothetical protein
MRCFRWSLLSLIVTVGPLASPLSAYDSSGLFVVPDDVGVLCYAPGADYDGPPPDLWSKEWRVSLAVSTPDKSRELPLPPIFEAQWTDEYHNGCLQGLPSSDVIQAWENDFQGTPFPEGNPLENLKRCGRALETPHSRYGTQIVQCDADALPRLRLNFSSFPLPKGMFFAARLLGASWVHHRDDVPGLYQRSLHDDWVLRKKESRGELNEIRLTTPGSRVFAVVIQGPGINSGDPTQYGSFICLYYIPNTGDRALNRVDRRRELLRKVLCGKLSALKIQKPEEAPWHPILPTLTPPALMPRPETPFSATINNSMNRIVCFSETPVRQSWLYDIRTSAANFRRPFLEAVYVHSYDTFNACTHLLLLSNLIWGEKAKGEELRQKFEERFNIDAIPPVLLNDLLSLSLNDLFGEIYFQINVQCFIPGREMIQCLRPHYMIANMPYPDNIYPCELIRKPVLMKLYGKRFSDNNNDGGATSDISITPPAGFLLKWVHTHEGSNRGMYWRASPNNCQILGTDNHGVSISFFSVVVCRCIPHQDTYNSDRKFEDKYKIFVTLHIVLEDSRFDTDADIARHNTTGSLCEIAKKYHDAWETKHQSDSPKPKNPFREFYDLLRPNDPPEAHPTADGAPAPRPRLPMVTIRPAVRSTT